MTTTKTAQAFLNARENQSIEEQIKLYTLILKASMDATGVSLTEEEMKLLENPDAVYYELAEEIERFYANIDNQESSYATIIKYFFGWLLCFRHDSSISDALHHVMDICKKSEKANLAILETCKEFNAN